METETKVNNQVQVLELEMKTKDVLKKLGIDVKGKVTEFSLHIKHNYDSATDKVEIYIKTTEVDRLKQIDYSKKTVDQ